MEMPDATVQPLTLAPKQIMGLELARNKKFVLFSGPRKSLKTVLSLTAICDHAWRIPHAEIAAITVSQSAGLESGVWDQLVDGILPKYMALGQGMQWVKKPYTATVSKKPACIVSNAYGGKTRIQLESLKDEREVEKRFKSKMYTMMYVPELSNFKNPRTFDIWAECLRSIHGLTNDQFLFLADTNPADEGDDSWLYHKWFLIPKQSYEEHCEFQAERGLPIVSERAFNSLKDSLGLLEFEIADNIFLSQNDVDELVARHSHDKDLYDRYILGLWVKASSGAIFARNFRENIHVVGELETPGNPDPLILTPQSSTWELFIGIDPGTSANSAGYIGEKFRPVLPNGTIGPSIYSALDEFCIIGEDHTLEEFTLALCEKMDWWENFMSRKFQWHSWSDASVFQHKVQGTKKFYHQVIYEVSKGRIAVQAADRSKGSVSYRIDLARRFLFENRMRISRAKCPKLIQMFKAMPAAKNDPNKPAAGSPYKHSFDGFLYAVESEAVDEIEIAAFKTLRQLRKTNETGLVSIAT